MVLGTPTQVEQREQGLWGRGECEVRKETEKEIEFLRALQVMVKNGIVLPEGLISWWLLYLILSHGPRLHPALIRSHKRYLHKTCKSANLLGMGLGEPKGT